MNFIRRCFVSLLMLGALDTSWAQASGYVGAWTLDVQSSKRPRAMIITQQGDSLRVRFGFQEAGAKLGTAAATLDAAGVLTLTSNSDSVIVLKLIDESTMKGTFTPRDGKQRNATATRSSPEAVSAVLGSSPAVVGPATESVTLAKAEVETLTSGKKWTFKRADNGQDVRWDLRGGGNLFGNNYSTNQKDSGTWSINEQGHLCTKWRGGSTERCMALTKDGDKLKMFDASQPSSGSTEVLIE